MKYEDKRIIDAEITKSFIHDNTNAITAIIAEFSSIINDEFLRHHILANGEKEYNFYLKGGNALSILDGRTPTGDFDFQLAPRPAVYNNWEDEFTKLDETIVTVLQHTIERLVKRGDIAFNENSFSEETLKGWARNANNPICQNKIDLSAIEKLERRNNIMFIGRSNGTASYANIIRRCNPKSMRLEDNSVSFSFSKFENAGDKFGPSIYVNYTIPGFILYRMVYCYKYRIAGEVYSLKSEIIDVSIPRLGSAEVFLSQEGNMTHFRRCPIQEYEFDIPGWGYHFYENINLLQEINLGLSGSPHKEQKRIERLELAMARLEAANARNPGNPQLDDIIGVSMYEPNETLPECEARIQGYLNSLILNVDDYKRYNQAMIAHVKSRSYSQTETSFKIFKSHHGARSYKDWQKLVFYKLKSSFDQTLCSTMDIRSLIGGFAKDFKRDRTHFHYEFLTPLLGDASIPLSQENIYDFPFNYVVVGIEDQYFDDFYKYCCMKADHGRIHTDDTSGDISAFVCTLNTPMGTNQRFSLVFYIIFQKNNNKIDMEDVTERFLENCICESQRHAASAALYDLHRKAEKQTRGCEI